MPAAACHSTTEERTTAGERVGGRRRDGRRDGQSEVTPPPSVEGVTLTRTGIHLPTRDSELGHEHVNRDGVEEMEEGVEMRMVNHFDGRAESSRGLVGREDRRCRRGRRTAGDGRRAGGMNIAFQATVS